MTKAINITEDIYLLIFNKWVELKNRGENISIGKVAEMYIKAGMDKYKEVKKEQKPDIKIDDKKQVLKIIGVEEVK